MSYVKPGEEGRFVIEGVDFNSTVLVTDNWHNTLQGTNIRRLTVRKIHFTRDYKDASQGVVLEVGHGFVTLKIDPKYPTIQSIYNWKSKTGRFLRKYQLVSGDCQIVEDDNEQIGWKSFKEHDDNIITLFLVEDWLLPRYQKGDLIGIKSKCCGHFHNTFMFCGGKLQRYQVLLLVYIQATILRLKMLDGQDSLEVYSGVR